jgi:3-oxosteroid 1-dehydrogenase
MFIPRPEDPTAPASRFSRRSALRHAAFTSMGAAFPSVFLSDDLRASDRDLPLLETVDLVVVGSGAAGMTAALTAAKRGLKTVVVEKAPHFGGSTARSGGGIWIRYNQVILAAGVPDTIEQAATYLQAVLGDTVAQERQEAFLSHGPAMLDFVMRHSPLRFRWMQGYSEGLFRLLSRPAGWLSQRCFR